MPDSSTERNHMKLAMIHSLPTAVRNIYYSLVLRTASAANPFGSNSNVKVDNKLGGLQTIVNVLTGGIAAVGIIFIILGSVAIATGIKSGEQSPESLTNAIKNIVVGALLVAIGWLVNQFV